MVIKVKKLPRQPQSRQKALAVQNRTLTLCFQWLREHQPQIVARLRLEAEADVGCSDPEGEAQAVKYRVHERLRRLCFHWVRDGRPGVMLAIRRQARAEVAAKYNGASQ